MKQFAYPRKAYVAITDQQKNGQTVYPAASAEYTGPDEVHVELCWIDQSIERGKPGREYGHAEFTGTVRDAEQWLRREGVQLDGGIFAA